VCFIPTASGDEATYISRYYEIYARLGAKPKHLPLFGRTPRDLRSYLLSNKIIQVGGGNTRSMIALWRYWGIDTILREAWEAGIVLTGSSAGMICWFTSGVTDSLEGPLTTCEGLGFLPGSACPHFNGEPERRPAYAAMIAEGKLESGYAADDGAGLHFRGTQLETAITAYSGATAYAYERDSNGKAIERVLPARNIA
jgi:dipeptidase E